MAKNDLLINKSCLAHTWNRLGVNEAAVRVGHGRGDAALRSESITVVTRRNHEPFSACEAADGGAA